ncbi:type II toxin-antitoxin system RelE/ParE family toxin [Arcobacter sp. s6]|uniref:type II toxin-antitoxin system RelE/ParE family toxin n=1 Tax=Arcobacter sp. s6 TaxID=3230363 RepID=UPI0034A073B2
MVDIHWTDEAENWLKNIYDYIALDKSTIAKKVVTEIYQKVQILQSFPRIGYEYENS